jgi:hypothetical protein
LDISLDLFGYPFGYHFGSAAWISGWVTALHSGNRACLYTCCHCHVFLSLLPVSGPSGPIALAVPGGAPASIKRLGGRERRRGEGPALRRGGDGRGRVKGGSCSVQYQHVKLFSSKNTLALSVDISGWVRYPLISKWIS